MAEGLGLDWLCEMADAVRQGPKSSKWNVISANGGYVISIEDNYGSVERYLREALDVGPVELAELRARYLD